jgi:hypothetical protein
MSLEKKHLKHLFFAKGVDDENFKKHVLKIGRKIALKTHPDKTTRLDSEEIKVRSKIFELFNNAKSNVLDEEKGKAILSVENELAELFNGKKEIKLKCTDVDILRSLAEGRLDVSDVAEKFTLK